MKYARQHSEFSNRGKNAFLTFTWATITTLPACFSYKARMMVTLDQSGHLHKEHSTRWLVHAKFLFRKPRMGLMHCHLVIHSDIITYASVTESQELCSENDKLAKDIISMYRNCSSDHYGISLGKYFYDVYCRKKFMNKNKKSKGEQQDDHTTRS